MDFDTITLPPTADFHVHLRDGEMMETVTPLIRQGGVDTVYVMPNLIPPITTVRQALAYRERLQALAPDVTFLMSLYLNESVTVETINEAAKAGITGVKIYPSGVTTNSTSGVSDIRAFDPIFAAMQSHNLILNLHGEVPSHPHTSTTVLTAEEEFLTTLHALHAAFPTLRIILEHCTTRAALAAVRAINSPYVAATITAHHLYLTVDDWCGDAFAFCKPVAKTPADRDALVRAAVGGEGMFFFGSDSAPHHVSAKRPAGTAKAAAGVFTQPYATQLVVLAVEEAIARGVLEEGAVTREALVGFLSGYGRRFYGVPSGAPEMAIELVREGERVESSVKSGDGAVEVVLSRAGDEVHSLRWKAAPKPT